MAETDRPVLVATEPLDLTADMVITELNRMDVPVVRFNPAGIGTDLMVSAQLGVCPAPVAGQLHTLSRTTDLEHVRAVYWRRPVWPTFAHLEADDARFAAAQVRFGLGGILYALEGPLWVNHPLRDAAADYKPAQLGVAQRLGLTVPPTLVTNDPDKARQFIAAYGPVIAKTLRWTPYERDGVPMTSWAEPVVTDEIDDALRAAPHRTCSRPASRRSRTCACSSSAAESSPCGSTPDCWTGARTTTHCRTASSTFPSAW